MQQSYEEIKKAHPDEWLILGDPVKSDDGQRIIAANLLYHSADKQELILRDKPLMKKCSRFAILFNKTTPHQNAVCVSFRTIGRMAKHPDAQPIKSVYSK